MSGLRTVKIVVAVSTLGLSEWRPTKQLARRSLHRVARFFLKLRSSKYDFDRVTTALVLAPHPDDEAFGCGGLIARKRLEGHPVHVVFVTDGSASHPRHPTLTPETLAVVRQKEARESVHKLGVDSAAVHFLGIRDGTLSHLSANQSADLISRLSQLLAEIRPDQIFLPCRRDGSSEHKAAFEMFQAARAKTLPHCRTLEFPVWSWWNPFLLWRSCFTARRVFRVNLAGYGFLKHAAIKCHRSQIEPCLPWRLAVQGADFVQLFLSADEFFYEN